MEFDDNYSSENAKKLALKFESNIQRLGSVYFSSEELEQIIQYYKSDFMNVNIPKVLAYAHKNFPLNPTFMVHSAEYFIISKSEKAKTYIENALEIEPNNAELILMYAKYYIQRKNIKKSIFYLTKAQRLSDNYLKIEVYKTEIDFYLNTKMVDKAKLSFYRLVNTAIKLGLNARNMNDYYIEEIIFYFDIMYASNHLEEAIDSMVDIRPYEHRYWYIKGMIHGNMSETKEDEIESCKAYEYAYLIKDKNVDYKYAYAASLLETNQLQKAEELYLEIMDVDHLQIDVYQELAELYQMKNEFGKAESILKNWLAKDPTNSDIWLNLAEIASETDRNDEALICFKNAYKHNNEYYYLSSLAEFYISVGEQEKAILLLQKEEYAVEDASLLIAETYANEKEYLTAIDYLGKIEISYPDNAEIKYRMASYFFSFKLKKRGIDYLIKALELNYDAHKYMLEHNPALLDNPDIIKIIEFYRDNQEDNDEFDDEIPF